MLLRGITSLLLIPATLCLNRKSYFAQPLYLKSEQHVTIVARSIAPILQSICDSGDVYQFNFIELHRDAFNEAVMSGVLKLIAGSYCTQKVISGFRKEPLKHLSGTQYYVVFIDNLETPENIDSRREFLADRKFYHGNARYIFAILLKTNYYSSALLITPKDYFRLHFVLTLIYNENFYFQAEFLDTSRSKIRQYEARINVEQYFRNSLSKIRFGVYYVKQVDDFQKDIRSYEYFFKTIAGAKNGRAVIKRTNKSDVIADVFMLDDIQANIDINHWRLLSMNRFRYLCVVTPSSEEKSLLEVIIELLQWKVGIAILLVSELIALLIYKFGNHDRFRRGLIEIHFELFQTFIDGPPNHHRSRLEELVIGMFVLFSMILIAIYESVLVAAMSNEHFYPEIATIEQVNNSKYPVEVLRETAERFNLTFKNQVYMRDRKNLSIKQVITPCDHVDIKIATEHISTHTVEEKLASHVESFAIMGFSPLGELISHYWSIFLEMDLMKYWQLKHFPPKYFSYRRGAAVKPLRLQDLNVAWFVVTVGLSIGAIAFVGENCMLLVTRLREKYFNRKADRISDGNIPEIKVSRKAFL